MSGALLVDPAVSQIESRTAPAPDGPRHFGNSGIGAQAVGHRKLTHDPILTASPRFKPGHAVGRASRMISCTSAAGENVHAANGRTRDAQAGNPSAGVRDRMRTFDDGLFFFLASVYETSSR